MDGSARSRTRHSARGPQRSPGALPSVFDRSGGSQKVLAGPLATRIRSGWRQITASAEVLSHYDYWSGNVVWRDGKLTGIVDWSGGARGPRGFDVGWCRLDLVVLFDERIDDMFLAAYEHGIGRRIDDMVLWDGWPSRARTIGRNLGSELRAARAR
jgi:aminoglycoside phosphotransferase (APT) family kinase protein